MKARPYISWQKWFFVVVSVCCACMAVAGGRPQSIKVVMDDNYPPYVFLDGTGKLQGILIDQWRLWEQKTGVKVELHAMDWGKAISGMQAGEFDVIDTIFKTEERLKWLDFTQPYFKIEVPIFFINAISGITDAASLQGFPVAVKAGDAAVELLKRKGVENLVLYNSYESVILAAKEHKVTVFVIDAPPGLYFLHKYGLQDEFKQSAPLNVGQFHRAVKKGNTELLDRIEDGFHLLSANELSAIQTKWFGSSISGSPLPRYILIGVGSLTLLLLTLLGWNRILCRRVESRTAELNASVEALQNLSLRQEAILSAIPDIIMEVDVNKVYTWANAAGLDFFGEDVVGKSAESFFAGEQNTSELVRPLFEGTSKVFYVESLQRRKDGAVRCLAWWCRELRDEHGQVMGALSTARDITERLRAESELQNMQKLTSVGTLAGGIAHDFNNILMGLFGNISLAKHEISRDHPGYLPLENAEKSMSRAIRLSNQLLTFAKGGDPVKEEVSLGPLVEDIAQFDLSGSNVLLVYQQVDDLWRVKVDKGQFQQVISNLTINARQAMPGGGHLYITLENSRLHEGEVPALAPGDFIKLSLRDEGTGMDAETMARIFEPYFTTKQAGHGLGLATVYSIIRKHEGYIGVASTPGTGTTFTVYLPAVNSKDVSPTRQPDVTAVPSITPGTRILVLDDEEVIRMFIPRWLKPLGCIVETTADGLQAIELYQAALKVGAPFDVLLLDLTIPGGFGGVEVIKAILAMDPGARAIVSSGYADGPIMANFESYGFKGVLAKPYTEQQLEEILARVMSDIVPGRMRFPLGRVEQEK